MKIQCFVKHLDKTSYDILFYDFETAQNYFARFLKRYLVNELSQSVGLFTQQDLVKHYYNLYELINKMPYYCENENGIKLSTYTNDFIADIKLINEL